MHTAHVEENLRPLGRPSPSSPLTPCLSPLHEALALMQRARVSSFLETSFPIYFLQLPLTSS